MPALGLDGAGAGAPAMAAGGQDATAIVGNRAARTAPGVDPDAHPSDVARPVVGRVTAILRSWTTIGGLKHQVLLAVRGYACPPIRRARCAGGARWVDRLPASLRDRFELDGEVIDPLRVEIGSGEFPSPGYVHVDANRLASHVEYLAPADALPFADGTVEEVLAVHILEHVHASMLLPTLHEWRRVLRPGGYAQVHVPDAANVFAAFLSQPPETKWTVLIPIFGKTSHARYGQPNGRDLERHHVIYDFSLLERVLLDAGFDRVEDVSAEVTDRHTEAWRDHGLIPRLSLVVRAYAR